MNFSTRRDLLRAACTIPLLSAAMAHRASASSSSWEPSVRETLQVGGDVRPWNEHENPFERIVQGLRDRGIASGVLAVEPTVRFFIVEGIRQVSNAYDLVSAEPLIRACRMIKSPAELALMQTAAIMDEPPRRWAEHRNSRSSC